MNRLKVECDPESAKVLADILMARISLLDSQTFKKLTLRRRLQIHKDRSDPELSAFRVQIPAKPLEVRAQMQNVPAQGLIEKRRVRRNEQLDFPTVTFDL